ncbi:hypothetical protein B0A79_08815 [Flavobacterium piscis]|uniref:Uncharacterized protein n=1 Tax=Flavobacterium piscis TaxID=1114874 RepID=A0ABX2XBU8_9FLAO|nr:hypothetical protein FLP_21325 [Flavobacterium piscis]OXG05448.1 hypothetical protein B0A79_08815 [Flavobacterium piscis]
MLRGFYKNTKFAKLCIEPALRTLCFYKAKLIQKLCVLCGKILHKKQSHELTKIIREFVANKIKRLKFYFLGKALNPIL